MTPRSTNKMGLSFKMDTDIQLFLLIAVLGTPLKFTYYQTALFEGSKTKTCQCTPKHSRTSLLGLWLWPGFSLTHCINQRKAHFNMTTEAKQMA